MLTLTCVLLSTCAHPGAQPLDDLRTALLDTRATAQNHEERCGLLAEFDAILEEPDSEASEEVARYYQGMVDQALDEVEELEVTDGVAVWKLYSSTFIVKTPTVVFAADLDEGPNSGSGGPDRVAGLEGIKLHMTPEQRTRIAELVDVSFHTHRHHDHISYLTTQALVDAGKTVVVPEDIRLMWEREPFAEKLTVLDDTPQQKLALGGLTVEVFPSRQWMATDHTVVCPCNAYLVTADNGVSVLFKGDINDGADFEPWLEALGARGEVIDLYLGHLTHWWGSDALPKVIRTFDPFLIPGHEFEFTHRKRGEAGSGTSSYSSLCRSFQSSLVRGKAAVLSWGERFDYRPSIHREASAPLVWLEVEPEPREVRVKAGESFRVTLNATSQGVEIKRWYLSFTKTDELRNLPGFDEREWGGILHDPDGDGVFDVDATGWPVGELTLRCTVDDWPDGESRTTERLRVTIVANG